jgi:hypothetical protein
MDRMRGKGYPLFFLVAPFVILSTAKDDKPASASCDSQHVFFELYCPLRVSCVGACGYPGQGRLSPRLRG